MVLDRRVRPPPDGFTPMGFEVHDDDDDAVLGNAWERGYSSS